MLSNLKPYVSQASEILTVAGAGALAGDILGILHPAKQVLVLTTASLVVVGGLVLGKILKT